MGKLLDAECYERLKRADSCIANINTSAIALDVSGEVYKLDEAGNSKAASALKKILAERSEPSAAKAKEVMVKIDGAEASGTINVISIEVQ